MSRWIGLLRELPSRLRLHRHGLTLDLTPRQPKAEPVDPVDFAISTLGAFGHLRDYVKYPITGLPLSYNASVSNVSAFPWILHDFMDPMTCAHVLPSCCGHPETDHKTVAAGCTPECVSCEGSWADWNEWHEYVPERLCGLTVGRHDAEDHPFVHPLTVQ
jgi:hypothetical protein